MDVRQGSLSLDCSFTGALSVSNGASLTGNGSVASNLTMALGSTLAVTLNGTV